MILERGEYARSTAQEEEGLTYESLEEKREARNSHQKLRHAWSQGEHMVAL